ncbi:hypothetical protein [Sorangium sp. So ce406]|uniref:hypothetical protein n=1 Tax=Sorangium sp. So ce406 TaxID=3133311 RepID=UPI003F5BB311
MSRASGGALSGLVLFCAVQVAAGCDAAPTDVAPGEASSAPTDVEAREASSAPTDIEATEASSAPTDVEATEASDVEATEASAPDPGSATSRPRHALPAPCALPRGFSAGAPALFPVTSSPAIGHKLFTASDTDAFGRFLRSTVMFCGPDEHPYFLRYRYYLTGPLSGRWLRPPLAEPL